MEKEFDISDEVLAVVENEEGVDEQVKCQAELENEVDAALLLAENDANVKREAEVQNEKSTL